MATKPLEGVAFEVHEKGNVTGKTWDGKFRAKAVLTFREQMAADRLRREFLGGNGQGADADVLVEARILSELPFRLTEAPEWWKSNGGGMDLADANILKAVWEGAVKVEEEHLANLAKEGAEAQKVVVEDKDKPSR